jgi:hypothetical protein
MARIDLDQLTWLEAAWCDDWDFFQSATGRYFLARFKHPRPVDLGRNLPSATVVADTSRELDEALQKERDTVAGYWDRMMLRTNLMERSRAGRVT